MDAFGDNFEQTDVDPAAEFLAREQNALAGLEDEVVQQPAVIIQPKNDDFANTNPMGSFEMINTVEPNELEIVQEAVYRNDIDYEYEPVSRPLQEPEKIKKWREGQKARLEEKDEEEEKKKDELREQAKKELSDWYKHHDESISKTKSSNRNAEKQFVAESDEIEPGTEWERIAKLCDFNPKTNKSSRDISRMRSIILQLKQNPIQSSKKV